jgi:hypothetical protein
VPGPDPPRPAPPRPAPPRLLPIGRASRTRRSWGDVRTASVEAPNWRTVGLSQLLLAAATVRRSMSSMTMPGGASGPRVVVDFYSEGNASEFAAVRRLLPEAALHLEGGPRATRDSLDRLSRADVLIGGSKVSTSSFFALAAHLCDACVVVTTRSPKFYPTTTARPAHHRVVSLRDVAKGTPSAGALFKRAWEELERDRPGQRVSQRRCDALQPPPRFGEDVLGAIPAWNKKELEREQRVQLAPAPSGSRHKKSGRL